jgi:hypothetical protein
LSPYERRLLRDLWKADLLISVINQEAGAPTGSKFTMLKQNKNFHFPTQEKGELHILRNRR